MNRCPKCGTEYPDDAKFCTKDGSRLVAKASGPGAVSPIADAGAANPMMVSGPRPTAAAGRGAPNAAQAYANLVGQTHDKRYKIERKLGEGGMPFVDLAADIATQAQFAIKVLSEPHAQGCLAAQPRHCVGVLRQ